MVPNILPARDLLDHDRRPTLLLRRQTSTAGFKWDIESSYANAALKALPNTLVSLHKELSEDRIITQQVSPSFKTWIVHCLALPDLDSAPAFQFCDLLWDFCSGSDDWILISARPARATVWPLPSDTRASLTVTGNAGHNVPSSNGVLAVSKPGVPSGGMEQERSPSMTVAGTDADLLHRIKQIRQVALILTNPDGEIIFANDYFCDISQLSRHDTKGFNWFRIFEEDELGWIRKLWAEQIGSEDVITWQAKLKRRWKPPPQYADAGENEPVWVMGSGHMNVRDGVTIGATGSFVDISDQKWLEKQQKTMLDQALDRAELSEQVISKSLEAATNDLRFKKLADGLAVGVYIAGADAVINYANPAYWKILGIGSSDKTPRIWLEAMEEDQLAQASVGFRMVYEEKVPVKGIEIRLKRRFSPSEAQEHSPEPTSESSAWVLFQAFPELNSDGSVLQVVGCVTDISHQKWVESFHSQQKEDAIAARLEQEKFMDMTSHEMRNPLAAVIHCAEEIVETVTHGQAGQISATSRDTEDVVHAARTILTCSQHARRIMDDVLTFSKMGARLLKIHAVPCQPVSVLRNALTIFQGDALASAAMLEFHVDESIDRFQVDWVLLDQGRCIQIVANLVTNALKFVRNQKVRIVDVTIAASVERNPMTQRSGFHFLDPSDARRLPPDPDSGESNHVFIHVIVDDTGCGIPTLEQSKLFGRFFQASHKTHTQYGGSGLGLSISKELCELQAGQIGFASDVGKGSTFSFYLKTSRTTAPGQDVIDGSLAIPRPSPPDLAHSDLSKSKPAKRAADAPVEADTASTSQALHIILVEDNVTNQKVLQRQLQRQNYSVTVANNGLEALEAIKLTEYWRTAPSPAQKLSLVLLDVEMPVMDGLTCIREIRKLEDKGDIVKRIPVIAVTANARQEQIDRALQAGMDDVLCKPFQFKELLMVIQRVM